MTATVKTGKSRSLYDQYKELVEVRADFPEYEAVSSIVFTDVHVVMRQTGT